MIDGNPYASPDKKASQKNFASKEHATPIRNIKTANT